VETVAVVRCLSYDAEEVAAAVRRVFSLCGMTAEQIPSPLLLKPNMLSARPPEDGVTTHPALLEAVRAAAPSSRMLIGDSPANAERPIEQYWDACGYRSAAGRMGASLVKFDSALVIEVSAGSETLSVPVTRLLKETAVLNLPKLKTHGLTGLTCSVKNLYGLIPGYHKSMLHGRFVTPDDFSRFLAAYYRAIQPRVFFSLVDAVTVMEGNGPSSGTLRHLGYIVGGRNCLAVDIVCCKLFGIPRRSVPHLNFLMEEEGPPEIAIVGDGVSGGRPARLPQGFSVRTLSHLAPLRPLLRLVGTLFVIEPEVNRRRCTKCQACVQVCPRDAISRQIAINRKRCIRCLCCFEVCPNRAIRVRKSFLARTLT